MKYKDLIINIEKDNYVEGGKIYHIRENKYGWLIDMPSLSLAKEFINVFNYYINLGYGLNVALDLTLRRVG